MVSIQSHACTRRPARVRLGLTAPHSQCPSRSAKPLGEDEGCLPPRLFEQVIFCFAKRRLHTVSATWILAAILF